MKRVPIVAAALALALAPGVALACSLERGYRAPSNLELVKLHSVAARLPEVDRAPFLADEREALLARSGEPLVQLMADDIARQLGP